MRLRHSHTLPALAIGVAMALTISACDSATVDSVSPDISVDVDELQHGDIIPGQYIVVVDEARAGKAAELLVDDLLRDDDVELLYRYGAALQGFAGRMSPERADELARDDRVKFVEPDRMIILAPCNRFPDHPDCGGGDGGGDGGTSAQSTPWGITRVNGGSSGAGKTAWVIDTGIDLDHPDLNVDASRGFNAFEGSRRDGTLDDGHGHGSHVAGTIAAKDNSEGVIGVAAGATVIPVKVLSSRGSGSTSGVIAGVNHVAANAANADVANMSLGGGVSSSLDNAVIAASSSVPFTLAAGNASDDANNHSPARANGPKIYTISAIDSKDRFASFSNYGNPPVDYAAPGVSIESTWKNGGYNTISGTSMAAPHVAGILLLGGIKNGGTANGDPDGNADTIAVN
jgi:subtilisin family serine protease